MIGGQDAGPCNTVERFTPAHDAWIAVAPMKVKRSGLACCAHDGRLFAVGGLTAGQHLSIVEVYDPKRNEWAFSTPLPCALSLLGLCSVDGILLAVGGEAAEGVPSARALRWDSTTRTWTEAASMSTPRDTFACAVLDGLVYVCGGWGKKSALATVERYCPARDAWTTVASMPEGRVACAATAVDGALVVVGGYNDASSLASAVRYDPRLDVWETLPSLPAARYGVACGTLAMPRASFSS